MSHAVAHVDLDALVYNLGVIRRRSEDRPVVAVIKADAYGHGASKVAACLEKHGVTRFAVATLAEGARLRGAGIRGRILVFGAPLPSEVGEYARYGLDLSVGSPEVLAAILDLTTPLTVHVKVDTGMTRLGLDPESAIHAVEAIDRAPHLELAAIWTHFATSHVDDHPFTPHQLEVWKRLRHSLGAVNGAVHAAASGTVFASPDVLEHSDFVRAGIGLFGLHAPAESTAPDRLRPVMRLVSRVVRVTEVEAGTPVSYGGTWRAPRRTRIATVSAGYADGFPRSLSNNAEVGLNGKRYPVVGKVCMDMLMVHVDDEARVAVGDEVTLFGEGGPSCFEIAERSGTVTYEIVCGVSGRVPRHYHGVDA